MQNLPIHFENPEFRKEVVRISQQSLNKIGKMCSGLSALSQKVEIKKIPEDLNQILNAYLNALNLGLNIRLIREFQPIPKICLDPEMIEKVLANLILNARDAIGESGEIRITTQIEGEWVELSVIDSGGGFPERI